MAKLSSGILVKLLTGMNQDERLPSNQKPVLLQIRSIIPVLAEGELWPKQGFFLRVSDSSHAIYASLPQEQDDLILSNKLQLGQYIYVDYLESANPVPLLKGVKLLPGRFPCVGNPEDLVSLDFMLKFRGVIGDSDSVIKKVNNHVQDNLRRSRLKRLPSFRSNMSKDERAVNDFDTQSEILDREIAENELSVVDKEIDTASVLSCVSLASAVKRRSWNATEARSIRSVSNSPLHKSAITPAIRSTSVGHPRAESPDDNVSVCSSRRGSSTPKLRKLSNKSAIYGSPKNVGKTLDASVVPVATDIYHHAEDRVLWDCLPSGLVKLGKEMVKHRDIAQLAAVEALQEASAAERLLKCLSAYSELQSTKGYDQQHSIDQFFKLQDDLALTRLFFKSLKNTNAPKETDSGPNESNTARRALKVAIDRKKKATSWIDAALANDLKPVFPQTKSNPTIIDPGNSVKHSSRRSPGRKGKGKESCIVKKENLSDQHMVSLKPQRDDSLEWEKGVAVCAATELDDLLQNECRRWFLTQIEQYLDQISSNGISRQSDSKVAGMMCQLKRVNEWLDAAFKKEVRKTKSKDGSASKDYDLETYWRVRNKIYGILMNYIDRTAMALEYRDATR